jgi:hypothetical protein
MFIETSHLQIVEGPEERADTWLPTSLLHEDVDIQTQTDDTLSPPPKSSSSSKPEPLLQLNECIMNPCLQVEDANECADAWSPTTLAYKDINIRTQTNDNLSFPVPPKSNLTSEGTATTHIPTSSATVASQNHLSSQSSQTVEAEAIARTFASPDAPIPTGRSSTRSAHLTEEQSELVQGLVRHHVALPTVVGVIEGMLREGQMDGSEADHPPEYDFV